VNPVAQVLWFSAPVIIAGLLHVAVIRLDWIPALARLSLDAGYTVRGRRLLGDNKTVRGAVVMISSTIIAASALAWVGGELHRHLAVAELQRDHAALWGLLLGIGYVLGELPNSFLKRQLDIAPGAIPRNGCGAVFWTLDQLDSVFGIFLALAFAWRPDAVFALLVIAVALVLHPAVAALMVMVKLKDRIG